MQTKEISEAIKNEVKERKEGFLPILLGTMVASVLIRGGEGVKIGQNF